MTHLKYMALMAFKLKKGVELGFGYYQQKTSGGQHSRCDILHFCDIFFKISKKISYERFRS